MQAALTAFVEQAATRLEVDILAGREIPFELDSRGRGASPLYCYRPLTGAFITERFVELRRLDGYAAAAEAIDGFEGLDRYLLKGGTSPGRRGERVPAGLLALLRDVFEEQNDFQLRPERLDRALECLEGSVLASAAEVTLVATLHGLTIASPELQLTRGLLLAHPRALRGVPDEAVSQDVGTAEDHLLVVFCAEDPDPHAAIAQGRDVVRELLRALRLFGDGRLALGPIAWTRIATGGWSTTALGLGGRPHGMLVVTAEQEDELRAFCNLVSRRAPHANELAWALRRFEMGCERSSEHEAISDHLMALRALLEPEGPASGLLAGRIAALCATPEQRGALTRRMLEAVALEREVISGKTQEPANALAPARDLSNHLRALLRDVICGHLPVDLVSLADELLLSGEQLGEEVLGDHSQSAEILHVAV
jgi:hypothetical protein